jgi:hypothetical protein
MDKISYRWNLVRENSLETSINDTKPYCEFCYITCSFTGRGGGGAGSVIDKEHDKLSPGIVGIDESFYK